MGRILKLEEKHYTNYGNDDCVELFFEKLNFYYVIFDNSLMMELYDLTHNLEVGRVYEIIEDNNGRLLDFIKIIDSAVNGEGV